MRLTGLARSTVYARIARSAFPAEYNLGGGVTGWHAVGLKAWLEARRQRG